MSSICLVLNNNLFPEGENAILSLKQYTDFTIFIIDLFIFKIILKIFKVISCFLTNTYFNT